MKSIEYRQIGRVKSPIKQPQNAPIQPNGAGDVIAHIEISADYAAGLRDLEGFSHIIVIYHFHQHKPYKLVCKPFLDDSPHGIFAIRAPNRPNPIGLSVVRLRSVVDNVLEVAGADMIDGTPVLDIKPYVATFDAHPTATLGWLEQRAAASATHRSDDRFSRD